MKIWLIVVLIALFLFFTVCTTHKESSSPTGVLSAREFNLCLTQGSWYLKQSDSKKALEQLKKAVTLRPDSSKAYNLLGIAYFQGKDYKMAKQQFEKALEINPSYAQAYNNLGGAYLILQEFDEAKSMFKKALSLSPDLVSAHYSLGTLLMSQGQIEKGSSYLSKGIGLDPDFLEKNEAFVSSFTSSTFGAPEVYFTYAKLYAQAGDVEKAVKYLNKAKKAGFKDWHRINKEKEFEKIKEDQRIKDFIKG